MTFLPKRPAPDGHKADTRQARHRGRCRAYHGRSGAGGKAVGDLT